MALDKQKILSELGNVVNQLQSANCGCMENIFGQSAQNSQYSANSNMHSSYGGHHPNYCYNHGMANDPGHSGGEPHTGYSQPNTGYSQPNTGYSQPNTGYPQPNTGYSQPNTGYSQPNTRCMGHCNPKTLYANTHNYLNNNLVNPVLKEVYDDLRSLTPGNTVANNPLAAQMGFPLSGARQNTPQDMSGQHQYQMAQTPITPTPEQTSMQGMGPNIMNMFKSNQNSYDQCSTAQAAANTYHQIAQPLANNTIPPDTLSKFQTHLGFQQMTNNNQPITQPMTQSHSCGPHAQGLAKFKEMFPGVMGQGDLGYDPMEIAIQMNPDNRLQVNMDAMKKMMDNNKGLNNFLNMNNQSNLPSVVPQDSQPLEEQSNSNTSVAGNVSNPSTMNVNQKLSNQKITLHSQSIKGGEPLYENNQQIYSVVAGKSTSNIQEIKGKDLQEQSPNSNTTTTKQNLPTIYESANTDTLAPSESEETPNNLPPVKEPIFPADTTHNQSYIRSRTPKTYEYNTLGQPVEKLPAKYFHHSVPPLPQTLSPQSTLKPVRYSNVKPTMSKTLIMDSKSLGKTVSKTELQRLYNNYKGSHSYTQHDANPYHGLTNSEGQLNLPVNDKKNSDVYVERTGGDTELNNKIVQKPRAETITHVGDNQAFNKQSDNAMEKLPMECNQRGRNGLQDIVYTSYPTSTAWSFHGTPRYFSAFKTRRRGRH